MATVNDFRQHASTNIFENMCFQKVSEIAMESIPAVQLSSQNKTQSTPTPASEPTSLFEQWPFGCACLLCWIPLGFAIERLVSKPYYAAVRYTTKKSAYNHTFITKVQLYAVWLQWLYVEKIEILFIRSLVHGTRCELRRRLLLPYVLWRAMDWRILNDDLRGCATIRNKLLCILYVCGDFLLTRW